MNKQLVTFWIAAISLALGLFNAFSKTSVKHEKFSYQVIERPDSLGGDTTVTVTKSEVYAAIANLNRRAPNHDAVVRLFVPWAVNATNELITQLELTDSTGEQILLYGDFVSQQLALMERQKSQAATKQAAEAQAAAAAKDEEIERLKAELEAAKQ